MEKSRVLDLLRPIVQSAQAPVLQEHGQQTAQAAAEYRGNGRMPIIAARGAVKSADDLARVTWNSMREALDSTRLEWTEGTHQELQEVLADLFRAATQALHDPFDRMGERYAGGVAAAKHSLDEASELHLAAAKARLELYVTARRRAEIVQVLTELEERLQQQAQAELLAAVRDARQQAQASHTNDGQLRETLTVLSQGLPTMLAAHDLGRRLLDVANWIRF